VALQESSAINAGQPPGGRPRNPHDGGKRTAPSDRKSWVVGADRWQNLRSVPFPHDVATPCLDGAAYEELQRSFPEPSRFDAGAAELDHRVLRLSSQRLLQEPAFAPCWQRFVEDHTSQAFWTRLVERYGERMRELHPGLETAVGRPLDQWKAVRRGTGERGDVILECQLVINTPVRSAASSVRAPHVDMASKLWTGLLYLRDTRDDTAGGDLVLYDGAPGLRFDGHQAPRDRLVQQATHPYAPNSFIGFVNSARALHSVSARSPGPWFRRYVDFVAELERPIFDVPQMGVLQRRWFRLRHRQESR